jgi:hypothetical protein
MVMILLTYRRVGDYKQGHLNYYLKLLKSATGEGLLAWAWVAELLERGAVHYHLVLVVRKGTRIPLPDKEHTAGGRVYGRMWSHGWSGIHTARSPYYLVKYVGKEYQKDLSRYPKSCRLYAASVRPRGGIYDDIFHGLAGLRKDAVADKAEGEGRGVAKWEYQGSSVTEGYAREIMVPSGYMIK